MLKNGIIEEGKGPWCSPIILVKKKVRDGKQEYRFCVDFRRLNQLTIKDSYPIPRIDETIDALGGSRYFTTLDLASGYWQIPMAKNDREKTAFCANHKLYQFRVMPFGLTNAPSTFQRLMDTLLKGMTWKQCLVYLDDVIIFANSFETHLERLNTILATFRAAKLKLKPSKCEFAMAQVCYLGFLITRDGLRPDTNKTRAIAELSAPGSKDEVKRFLGMLSYYRRFINRFSSIASCLFEQTKTQTPFTWSEEHQKAFDSLKQQLVQAPVLAYPEFDKEFEIYTDASGVGIGGVLVQRKNDRLHPIAFASRQLNRHERNYSTSEREMLAIVWASKHFKPYIYDRHTKFFTDHKPLSILVKSKEPTGRLYKLLLKLQDLDHEIVYVPGALNNTADALSRVGLQKAEVEVNKIGVELQVEWSDEQSKDRELAIVRVLVKTGKQDEVYELQDREFWLRNKEYLLIEDDVLVLKDHAGERVIVVPNHLRAQVCQLYHDSLTAGHLGFEKTYKAVSSRFYWPRMKSQIYDHCASCDVCQRFKQRNNQSNTAPLILIKVNKPWDLIAIDIAGPLKLTSRGNKYFIVAVGELHGRHDNRIHKRRRYQQARHTCGNIERSRHQLRV